MSVAENKNIFDIKKIKPPHTIREIFKIFF